MGLATLAVHKHLYPNISFDRVQCHSVGGKEVKLHIIKASLFHGPVIKMVLCWYLMDWRFDDLPIFCCKAVLNSANKCALFNLSFWQILGVFSVHGLDMVPGQ